MKNKMLDIGQAFVVGLIRFVVSIVAGGAAFLGAFALYMGTARLLFGPEWADTRLVVEDHANGTSLAICGIIGLLVFFYSQGFEVDDDLGQPQTEERAGTRHEVVLQRLNGLRGLVDDIDETVNHIDGAINPKPAPAKKKGRSSS